MFLLCLCDNSNFPLLHLVTVFKKENNVCSLGSSELQKILGSLYKCRMICMVQLMFKNWVIFNQHQPMKDGSAHCILCDMGMAFSDSLCSVTCSSTTESDILIYILNPDLVLQFSGEIGIVLFSGVPLYLVLIIREGKTLWAFSF